MTPTCKIGYKLFWICDIFSDLFCKLRIYLSRISKVYIGICTGMNFSYAIKICYCFSGKRIIGSIESHTSNYSSVLRGHSTTYHQSSCFYPLIASGYFYIIFAKRSVWIFFSYPSIFLGIMQIFIKFFCVSILLYLLLYYSFSCFFIVRHFQSREILDF